MIKRVYHTSNFNLITNKIRAHEAEILTLDFSKPTKANPSLLLATGSRDRLIHVFNVLNNCEHIKTLSEHSASITSVKFANTQNGELKLLSCSADKSIVFRTVYEQVHSLSETL